MYTEKKKQIMRGLHKIFRSISVNLELSTLCSVVFHGILLKLRLSCVKVYNNITKYYHSNGKQNTHTKQLQKVSTCSKHSADLAFIGFMLKSYG